MGIQFLSISKFECGYDELASNPPQRTHNMHKSRKVLTGRDYCTYAGPTQSAASDLDDSCADFDGGLCSLAGRDDCLRVPLAQCAEHKEAGDARLAYA